MGSHCCLLFLETFLLGRHQHIIVATEFLDLQVAKIEIPQRIPQFRDIGRSRRAHFHDDIVVEIGPNTKVFRDGDRVTDLGIGAISIGQRVTVRGNRPDAAPV